MEIYRLKANQEVSLPIPVGITEHTAKVSSPAYPTPVAADAEIDGDNLTLAIPFKHTLYDGPVTVTIGFTIDDEQFFINRDIEVVTPLFVISDFDNNELKALRDPSEDDVKDLERFIRHIIEAYTGQSFGMKKDTVLGDSYSRIAFDAPLLEFTGISSRYATHSTTTVDSVPYELVDDGFGMAINWDNYHIKSDTFWLSNNHRQPGCISITGNFGYREVPTPVREAALILTGLFTCDQSLWRDRYIENLRNADGSSIKYHEGAYHGTGSVSADQLLSRYVRSGFSADVI